MIIAAAVFRVQVVGSKSVVLFAPEHSAGLYPTEGIMCNTSQIDIGADWAAIIQGAVLAHR